MVLPNFTTLFTTQTDACDTIVGALFETKGHPLACMIKELRLINIVLSISEKGFFGSDHGITYMETILGYGQIYYSY
jgi:hypothetical protein